MNASLKFWKVGASITSSIDLWTFSSSLSLSCEQNMEAKAWKLDQHVDKCVHEFKYIRFYAQRKIIICWLPLEQGSIILCVQRRAEIGLKDWRTNSIDEALNRVRVH